MSQVILHIGASKCGSSALQTMFTEHPVLERRDGTRVAYAAVDGQGSVRHGEKLRASNGIRGYCSSVNAKNLAEFSAETLA
jgi:hypothetical protein